ncbi:hypothetical protein [Actinoplanes sp. NPDC051411]|uniref:hypothetical protein n=1 Tax=Actinoplanes sp. NPDC051411 TaxID=3155522 RepID=UPI003431CDF1
MAPRRPAAAGLVVAMLLAGCAGHTGPPPPAGCPPDGTAPTAAPRPPEPVGTTRPVLGGGGLVDAQVTEVLDPLPEGTPDTGCRLVSFGLRLLAHSSVVTVDLFSKMRLVTANGDFYQPYVEETEGRDDLDNAELMPGDERRGRVNFEVPAAVELSYFAIDSLVADASKPAGPVRPPPYRPGNWPGLGATQVADRLPGERLEVTPLKIMDPTPAGAGVKAGRRAYSVQLRLRSVGTRTWPFNPEITTTFIDSRGRNWIPGFVTTTAAPPFDPLHGEPGGKAQTGWVTGEIPGDARIVAVIFSPYTGVVYAWRV